MNPISRQQRRRRVRSRISGTDVRPRVSVHRSAKYISLQLIDDRVGKTIVCVNSKNVEGKGKIEKAQFTGEALAKKAVESGVTAVVFDRSGYRYHGRVKAAADGLRAGGLDV